MDSIVERLADIEKTAESIVDHAEEQKAEIEKRIQTERDQFDLELEEKTQAEIHRIRSESETKMNQILDEQREKNRSTIDNLKAEYEEHHNSYAREILQRIIEV